MVEGIVEGIRDTPVRKNLVLRVGKEEARQILLTRLIMRDKKAATETRH